MVTSGGGEGRDIIQRLIAQVLPWLRLHDGDREHLAGEILRLVMAILEIAGASQVA